MSEPIYRRVEAVDDDETLVRKLEEGAADWLAIDERGRYLVENGTVVDEKVVIRNPVGIVERALDELSLGVLSIVFSVVVAFGFGFAFLGWLPALLIAIAAFAIIVMIIRWRRTRRPLVRFAAWMLARD